MKVLLVHAHPDPRSLSASLRDVAVARLERAGHEVAVSDLYAMRWKTALDADDFGNWERGARLDIDRASKRAFEAGALADDIAAEQQKMLAADVLLLQFPLWWYSMPAILKGWVDRVFACGFAYGVGEHSDRKWGKRFGEGTFAGKRAMLVVSVGGWSEHYGARGINGPIDDLLFPIHHGILYYPGYQVLPPYVVYRTGKLDAARFTAISDELGARLDALDTTPPIPFRPQNDGDYTIPTCELVDGLSVGRTGFAMHQR